MKIFAIADLHLGFSTDKPMDKFGDNWHNHHIKIEKSWRENVTEGDLVLIPGDISWAINFEESIPDLSWIEDLPGKKVISKGNHDYWWKSVTKMNEMFESIFFLQNSHYTYHDYNICAARGWLLREHVNFKEEDEKIYRRELIRLENSIESALKFDDSKEIIAMLHYPPVMKNSLSNEFTEIIKKYGIKRVIYGHLHTRKSWIDSIDGLLDGVKYELISSDYLNFNLKRIV